MRSNNLNVYYPDFQNENRVNASRATEKQQFTLEEIISMCSARLHNISIEMQKGSISEIEALNRIEHLKEFLP